MELAKKMENKRVSQTELLSKQIIGLDTKSEMEKFLRKIRQLGRNINK